MVEITILGRPITKKNSQQIIVNPRTKRPMIIPSPQYRKYKTEFMSQCKYNGKPVNCPVNVEAVYYMPTRHKVDLTNLLSATHDLLVDCKVLEDDNSKIVKSVDGSRVEYDKSNPRVEIKITKTEEK